MANQKNEDKSLIFQFNKSLDYPVFLLFEASSFDPNLTHILQECQFSKLEDKEKANFETQLKRPHARVLRIVEATAKVAAHIGIYRANDELGPESITSKEGHHIYRYKGQAMMVFSHGHYQWELGVYDSFGSKSHVQSTKVVINRYLSLALGPLGIVGFWGVPLDSGALIMNQKESMGVAIYFDLNRQKLLTSEGEKKLKKIFQIVRLDPTLKVQSLGMGREDLLSFLFAHCTYFSSVGLSIPVRQIIQEISKFAKGTVHPKQSFKKINDLSY